MNWGNLVYSRIKEALKTMEAWIRNLFTGENVKRSTADVEAYNKGLWRAEKKRSAFMQVMKEERTRKEFFKKEFEARERNRIWEVVKSRSQSVAGVLRGNRESPRIRTRARTESPTGTRPRMRAWSRGGMARKERNTR